MPIWVDISGMVVVILAVFGIIIGYVGLFTDKLAVITTGVLLIAVPVLSFILTFAVVSILMATGVDIGPPNR
jgi:hypothetical protein